MRKTKRSLITSILSLLLCFSMLVSSTFAWFTDSASTGVNKIVSGSLDVALEMWNGTAWVDAEGEKLNFIAKDGNQNILWEPGCTYELPAVRVVNKANLHLKYTIAITGIDGDAKLNEAIEWKANGGDMAALSAETPLAPGAASDAITISGHMKEEAGNEYQDLTIDGISITVYATQYTAESDSFGNQYDANATFPEKVVTADATVQITAENGVLTAPVTYTNASGVAVTIPAGVKVNAGVTGLGIRITKKAASDSNLTVKDNEIINAYDVHVEGIAADNTVPVIVLMEGIMPKNMNSSALTISHVEAGGTVAMTYVASDAELTAHNQFQYDPATGDLTVAMATFSEVTLLVDTTNPWDGTSDETWYNTTDTEFTIRNAQQLAGLAQIVAGGTTFEGKTVKLAADIDLSGHTFYPIGAWAEEDGAPCIAEELVAFKGTFDGTGHKISNIHQDGWEMGVPYNGRLGLFAHLANATVKNLNLDTIKITMEFTQIGSVAAIVEGDCTFENIAVTNADLSSHNTAVAGIVGRDVGEGSNFTFKNITVDASNTIRALWGVYDTSVSGILGYLGENSYANFDKCNVAAVLDVYNDYCGNYQWGIYRYCGMFIGSVKKTTTAEDGRKIADLSNVTATNCTVNFGEWHEQYYYCEFESNGHPSYAGENDYKYSRVPYEDITITDGVATCNHNHTAAEDGQAVQFVFDSVFGSYGNWGVSPIELEKYPAITVSDITNAEEKFEVKFENTDKYLYRVGNGNAVNLSSLFNLIEGKEVNLSGMYVSMTKLDIDTDVAMTFTANPSDWSKGTLQFTGTGPVKITIQDYDFCAPTELLLEIVDGKNVTTAANATANNVVLLNDVSGGFSVSNGYTFYGNGFKVDLTNETVQSRYSAGSVGYVNLSGGNLDNVQIIGPTYPVANIYRDQAKDSTDSTKANYFYNSVIVNAGNSAISNCYISGSRTAIYVGAANNLVLDNTTVEGGAYVSPPIL